ncbi:peptidase M28 [Ramlibacter sp. Leaf400]|nr:peptidase M28 [Ramlibacter sp. Leaf400]
MHALVRELYPICRSITGDGLRQTLARLGREIPLAVHEVPTGSRVFDWTVPREWNIRDAYVKNAAGERVIDFQRHNLHVVNYSVPVQRRMTLAELRPHLHSLPDRPELIPYRTSYYKDSWGFCLPHRQLEHMPEGEYEVCIDSTLEDGHLSYGECLLPGSTPEEVLVSCHACHPSLADDNLSGLAVATFLARHLARQPRRYSYRFVFVPGTIGSITWLSRNEEAARNIRHGLVLTCIGDRASFTYKRSRRGNAAIDRAVEHVLAHADPEHAVLPFSPYGYDERQYCSPGFNLPVGCLMRSHHGQFPQYHTSADNPDFVTPEALAGAFDALLSVLDVLENDGRYLNLKPYCEPQLGQRGLYGTTGGTGPRQVEMAMLWVLNFSDGESSLLDIAQRANLPFATVREAAALLERADLLAPAP